MHACSLKNVIGTHSSSDKTRSMNPGVHGKLPRAADSSGAKHAPELLLALPHLIMA